MVMLKMTRLNYRFDEKGEVAGVDVGFEDWTTNAVDYTITVKLSVEDADLTDATPAQLKEAAQAKVAALVAK